MEQVRDEISRTVKTLPIREQTQRLDNAYQVVRETQQSEQTIRRFADAKQQQNQLENRVEKLLQFSSQQKQTVHHEINIQSQSPPDSRPPRLVSPLNDAQVEEGQRFEFKVKIDGSPEPQIEWAKDGREIRGNADYQSTFLNGFATLTIEETFIEDSAIYTLRANNPLGSAQASARLTVKCEFFEIFVE